MVAGADILVAVCVLIVGPSGAQEKVPEKPAVPTFTIVVKKPEQVGAVKEAVSKFEQLQKGLGDNFDEIKQAIPKFESDELKKKALERLKRIEAEMERLNARAKDLVDALNDGKPLPSLAKDADPEAYKDKDGNDESELLNKLLEVGIAGICIYQPQYCAVAMLIAKMLGLNLNNIRESTRALGSLNDSVQAGKADQAAIDLVTKNVPGLDPDDLKGIIEGTTDPKALTEKMVDRLRSDVAAKIKGLSDRFGVEADKISTLAQTIIDGKKTAEQIIQMTPWLDSPSDAEKKAALELLSLLAVADSAKADLIEQLQRRVQKKMPGGQ